MSANSKIEWCHHSFNIAWGCIEASAGCDHCYARPLARRYGYDVWGKGADRRIMSDAYWRTPLLWDRLAARAGERHRVFSSSMTDNFLNDPIIDREREKLWPLIERTPNLDWLLLTKHPERFRATLPATIPSNVRLGVSVEDNSVAWRVDAVRPYPNFLSVEPMLGPVDRIDLTAVGWVICGGESGSGARPMDFRWARDLRDRCVAAGIPFLFKQWGEYAPAAWALGGSEFPHDMVRVGKANAGRELDGRTWDEFPQPAAA